MSDRMVGQDEAFLQGHRKGLEEACDIIRDEITMHEKFNFNVVVKEARKQSLESVLARIIKRMG